MIFVWGNKVQERILSLALCSWCSGPHERTVDELGHLDELGILLSANHRPRLRSTENRRIEHFLHHKPVPFASGSGLLERSSTLRSRDPWPKRNFVGLIAMLLTAHTSRGGANTQMSVLLIWARQYSDQISSGSRPAFKWLQTARFLSTCFSVITVWRATPPVHTHGLSCRSSRSHQPTAWNACSVTQVSSVAVFGPRNAAIPLSGLTLLRWEKHTIGRIDASNLTVCVQREFWDSWFHCWWMLGSWAKRQGHANVNITGGCSGGTPLKNKIKIVWPWFHGSEHKVWGLLRVLLLCFCGGIGWREDVEMLLASESSLPTTTTFCSEFCKR
jgi:hypothetical protein